MLAVFFIHFVLSLLALPHTIYWEAKFLLCKAYLQLSIYLFNPALIVMFVLTQKGRRKQSENNILLREKIGRHVFFYHLSVSINYFTVNITALTIVIQLYLVTRSSNNFPSLNPLHISQLSILSGKLISSFEVLR